MQNYYNSYINYFHFEKNNYLYTKMVSFVFLFF